MRLNVFSLQPFVQTTARVVSQAMSRGGGFAIKTGLRALPIVFHLSEHLRLSRLMNTPNIRVLTQHQPRLGYKYLGGYLALRLTRQARLRILYNHYEYLARQVQDSFFASLLDGIPLWEDERDGDVVSIRLAFPSGIDFEGDLALTYALNDVPLYNISFVVSPGQYVDSAAPQVLFVSRIQGTRHFELIRHATKTCHDITPAALLIAALQGIAEALDIRALTGISNADRLYETITFDYDSFWESFNADKETNGLFSLPLPLVKTPIELIKGKRRERTLRKRHYKDQVCETVQGRFAENMLHQYSALA